MILSDCYGNAVKGEYDLIVRGPSDKVKHELMHILLMMRNEDVFEIVEDYLKFLKEGLNENDTDINNDN